MDSIARRQQLELDHRVAHHASEPCHLGLPIADHELVRDADAGALPAELVARGGSKDATGWRFAGFKQLETGRGQRLRADHKS